VRQLAAAAVPPHCANPYSRQVAANACRRHNLRRYLASLAQQKPHYLLVGEAPGYRGCRISGIPFVSPQLLRAGWLPDSRGYRLPSEWQHIKGEASASIVWQVIGQQAPLPLLWNVFPFHPHQPEKPQSNRTPTKAEIELGEPFLRQLWQMYERPLLVAVGRQAAEALVRWQMPHHQVRHPAHGGKTQFTAGVATIFATFAKTQTDA
jgi:uracil-DNA glycosylase